jgi:hypothetical protein
MKQFETLEAMKADTLISYEVLEEVNGIVFSCEDDHYDLENVPFKELFGGDFFLIETEEDLQMIWTTIESPLGDYFNITEISAVFDDARYTLMGGFAVITIFTNDDGGPVWYIPRDIADKYPTIANSILMSNDGKYVYGVQ